MYTIGVKPRFASGDGPQWPSRGYRIPNSGQAIASLREVSMQRLIQSVLAAAILLGTAATTRAESVMEAMR
jgi:hypothetical protein